MNKSSEGKKFDNGKLRWCLLPMQPIIQIIKVLMVGADKYGDENWKKVEPFRERYYNALMRHINAWWLGEKNDPEDGLHHLAHAACCILFLIWGDDNGII